MRYNFETSISDSICAEIILSFNVFRLGGNYSFEMQAPSSRLKMNELFNVERHLQAKI